MASKESYYDGVIKSLGLVFGDIGTSPIYTFTVIMLALGASAASLDNVLGVLSLILWTLLILVTLQYVFLAMGLGKKGEGGTIVLKELLVPLIKSGRKAAFATLLCYVGVSLLMGDGVITPAISILSAVEGVLLIPGFENTSQNALIFTAAAIAFALFAFQKRGTDKVAGAFGPVMIVWFAALAISGVVAIASYPGVFAALSPYYAFKFMMDHGIPGFFILSEVILCATGGEALYADMGHLGSKPIIRAWNFVLLALLINYFGQGAFLLNNPEADNVLFSMVFSQSQLLYLPFLLLSICATIIASQAMISGMFSIVYQGITTKMFPPFNIDYTSSKTRSQIYIEIVNWVMLAAVVFIMFTFKSSEGLASAYGIAVTGDMTITAFLMVWIFYYRKNRIKLMAATLSGSVAFLFLLAALSKIPSGGYISILIAAVPLSIILIYVFGQNRLHSLQKHMKRLEFIEKFKEAYASHNNVKGTALFLVRDLKDIPHYVVQTVFENKIIYEDNVLISIVTRDQPFGVNGFFKEPMTSGLKTFEIGVGYMEVPDLGKILRDAGLGDKTIFYGIDEIVSNNILWKGFSVMKKLSPPFAHFYDLESNRINGVLVRVEM